MVRVVKGKFDIIIDNDAKVQLQNIYLYIKQDSPKNAKKVRDKILSSIKKLTRHPLHHPPDKYRLNNNDGSYRAYEVYKYRITYYISPPKISMRIRHTGMEPLPY